MITDPKSRTNDSFSIASLILQLLTICLLGLLSFLVVQLQRNVTHLAEHLEQHEDASSAEVQSVIPYKGDIRLMDSPIQNSFENSSIVMIEFTDFECDYCKKAASSVAELLRSRRRIVRVHKDFPLIYHEAAQPAAVAARCAGEQGQYWAYYERLFAMDRLDVGRLDDLAENLNLDMDSFKSCRENPVQFERIRQDFNEGVSMKVDGTPTFLIGEILKINESSLTVDGVFCKMSDLKTVLAELCENGREDACEEP